MSIFEGRIVSGHGRGKVITFPTLNLAVKPAQCPEHGVYVVLAHLSRGPQKAVMHVGPRPTFQEKDVSIEVHLLDFFERVDQETLQVEVLGRLRDVASFDSPEELKKQIAQDIMDAQQYFQ
jgi:riboflavin kinase/FMN adenylyltransferase